MDGADSRGPQLLTPHWPAGRRPQRRLRPGQAALLPKGRIVSEALGGPGHWGLSLTTTQDPERLETGGEQAGSGTSKLPHPAPGGQSSPQGQPRTGWKQAVRRSADQSSRPETTVGLGWAHSVPVGGMQEPLGPDLARPHPTSGQRPPRREHPGGSPGPHGPQRWTHLFQLTSLGKTRPRRMVQSSVGS